MTHRARAIPRTRRAAPPSRQATATATRRCASLVGSFLDLGRDRVRIGVDLPQDVANDVVPQSCVEEVFAVEVEVSPFERRLRGPLQQFTCRVAEVLRDVDPLDLPLRCGSPARGAPAGLAVPEEVGEEVVEETAAATAEPARHLLFGKIDLAEILDFLRPVRVEPYP